MKITAILSLFVLKQLQTFQEYLVSQDVNKQAPTKALALTHSAINRPGRFNFFTLNKYTKIRLEPIQLIILHTQ